MLMEPLFVLLHSLPRTGKVKVICIYSSRALAEEAGFRLDAASEINANPKDTKDHPFGVWTLPPTRRSGPAGQPAQAG